MSQFLKQARERNPAYHEDGTAWTKEWKSEVGVMGQGGGGGGRVQPGATYVVRMQGVVERREQD